MSKIRGAIAAVLFLGSVVLANYMIGHIGRPTPHGPHLLPVGFGLMAPSGVYVVGVSLVLRDVVQWTLGKTASLIALALGAALSYLVADPFVAVASAAAFGLSELLDFAIFTPMQKRTAAGAVLVAGLAGAALDSYVFLILAFHSTQFFTAQWVGKSYGIILAALLIPLVRRRWLR